MDVPSTVQSGTDPHLGVGGRKQSLHSAEGCGKEDLSKTSLQSPLKSWAAMVGNSVQKEFPKLGDLEIREENGRKFIFIPDDVYEEMSKPFRFAAIGTFYGGGSKANMEYSFVFLNLRHQWKEVRNPRFFVLGKGLYLIRVDSHAELQVVLRRNSWRIGAKTFVASRWCPGMEMKVDHSTRIPIWIQIPNLASELWNQAVFDGIARTLGVVAKPLKPNLLAAWIAGEEKSSGASSNKIRRPLGLPQLASATTNHTPSSNALHISKFSGHKPRSESPEKIAVSIKGVGSGNSLSSHDFKKHAGKSSSHGKDLDSRLVLAFQAPPSWPIDPGDTRTQVTDLPTSSPPPPVENQDLIMEVDPGVLNAGSKPVPPPEKVAIEPSLADPQLNCSLKLEIARTQVDELEIRHLVMILISFIADNNFSIVEDPRRHFTWSNKWNNSDMILCKLDWAMVNVDWVLHVGAQNNLQILPRCASDHSALVLRAAKTTCREPKKGQFKFLKNWSLRGECEEVIKEGWSYQTFGCAFIRVLSKMEVTRSKLSLWNRIHYGNLSARIDSLQKELDTVQARMDSGDLSLSDLEYCIRLELQATLKEEELLWAQKIEFLQELKSIMADFEIKAGMRVNDAKSRMVIFNAHEDLSNLAAASTGNCKHHLVAWKKLCRPKGEGGVGLKSLTDLNKACLGNLASQVGHTTSSWATLVSKKYLMNHSLWTRKGNAKDSWLWKSIEWGWDTIKHEFIWSLGNGTTARAWLDDWGEGILMSKVPSSKFHILEAMRSISVAGLKTATQYDFDANRLAMEVIPHLNHIGLSQSQDSWQWKGLQWDKSLGSLFVRTSKRKITPFNGQRLFGMLQFTLGLNGAPTSRVKES
ncbi:putative ribonuclease H protein [Nymphaea thermarum]|nr:putative ribonuclease H protein [Nymphaea thermarum]